jgi:hypothetical protein
MKNSMQRFVANSRFWETKGINRRKPFALDLMKTRLAILGAILLFSFTLAAQHPLIGTWEMVSIKGIGAGGEKFSIDTSTVREVKIITPTHYMLIAHDVQGDSLVFNRSYAGTIKLDGNKYIEYPTQASVQIFDNVKTDFTWKIEGDKFIQAGTLIRPDGKKVVLEEMVFKRVKTPNAYPQNPAIGAWSQLSSAYTNFDGSKDSHTNATTTRFHIITPTHWMRISHRDKKFEHVMGGTYTMKDGKTYPTLLYQSGTIAIAQNGFSTVEMSEQVKNDKLYVKGVMTGTDGKKFTWEDVFERSK